MSPKHISFKNIDIYLPPQKGSSKHTLYIYIPFITKGRMQMFILRIKSS